MIKRFNFTQAKMEKLPFPEKGRIDYYDTDTPKLTMRVSSTGNKTFYVTKWNGKTTQRIALGRFPDISVSTARKKAQKALVDLAAGINPIEKKRKEKHQTITLSQLLERYLEQKQLRPATELDYRKKIRQGFPDWLDKPAKCITREMILARHKKLTSTGIVARDNKMRVMRLLMHYAVALKAVDHNPVDILKEVSLWAKPKRKDRIIPAEKLPEWYEAVLNLDNQKAKVYLLMLLYTGIRSSEALYLEWSDVNFKKDTFLVRDTKNHSDFTVQMPAPLKPYLKGLQQVTGKGKYVFPGDRKDGTMDIPRKPIMRIGEHIGQEFSSHDMRRVFATIAESAMLPETIIKRLLNHKTDNNVTGGYIRTETDTMKEAMQRIADSIQARVSATQDSNIVLLNRSTTN